MKAYSEMEQNTESYDDFTIADAQFHRLILHASANEFLIAMENLVYSALIGSISITNQSVERNVTSLRVHRQVGEAICAGDLDLAEATMVGLLADTKRDLDKFI